MANASCLICDKKFKKGEEIKITTCDHKFHNDCFNFCFERSPKCPQCKKNLSQGDISAVNFGSERKPEMKNGTEFDRINDQILALLKKKDDNDDYCFQENSSSRAAAERTPQIINGSGTVVQCNTYEPTTYNFGFSLIGSPFGN